MILAMDLGSTNWKAAVFDRRGRMLGLSRMPSPMITAEGQSCFDAEALPGHLEGMLSSLGRDLVSRVSAVALTGMAESGGLVDTSSLTPRTEIRAWWDGRSLPIFDAARGTAAFERRYEATGLPDSFKYGIYKILALRSAGADLKNACFLGVAEQACMRLTGRLAIDPTLAARTGAYGLRSGTWDEAFLQRLALPPSLFPNLVPTGSAAGTVPDRRFGLNPGTPVCICGHDHVCAAYGAGALQSGSVMLSMGTAQVMITSKSTFDAADLSTGLSFGPGPGDVPFTCLGSIQAAGGSINYWKKLLFPNADYAELIAQAEEAPLPTGLTWLPYLGGSGAPHLDPHAPSALLGMKADTGPGDILAAVYEGIAMETRFVLERMGKAKSLICIGGLTRHERLMRILAAVTGASIMIPQTEEGTLYGAARLAAENALGEQAFPAMPAGRSLRPDPALQDAYEQKYRSTYLPLMQSVLTHQGVI